MLAGVIKAEDFTAGESQKKGLSPYVDIYEIRLDFFYPFSLDAMAKWIKKLDKPFLFTLRKKSQGGVFPASEPDRIELIYQLAELGPAYFDIEWEVGTKTIQDLYRKYPKIRWIISHHLFTSYLEGIEKLYREMKQPFPCLYKIAVKVDDALSLMELLLFSKKEPKLSLIPMGQKFSEARVLGPFCCNPIDYAALFSSKDETGILSAKRMQRLYQYHKISKATSLYALIGSPVTESIGHIFHNYLFQKQKVNALYIRIEVEPKKVHSFLLLAKKLPFSGFSVTSPLKEETFSILGKIEESAQKIEAINTLLLDREDYVGYNSDGKGVMDLFSSVQGKKVLLIGAGGAAKAIAYEAMQRKAELFIYNRTEEKAKAIARKFKATAVDGKIEYDILINTTPFFHQEWVTKNVIVVDIRQRPKWTSWLKEAKKKRALPVFGREMFIKQALLQNYLWRFREMWPEDLHLHENVSQKEISSSL